MRSGAAGKNKLVCDRKNSADILYLLEKVNRAKVKRFGVKVGTNTSNRVYVTGDQTYLSTHGGDEAGLLKVLGRRNS